MEVQAGTEESISIYFSFKLLDGDVEWNDLALIDQFRERLANELRDKLVRQGAQNTMKDLFQHCVIVEGQLEELRQGRNRKEKRTYNVFPIQPHPILRIQHGRTVRAVWDNQNRREQGLCYYYVALEHTARSCPAKNSNNGHNNKMHNL